MTEKNSALTLGPIYQKPENGKDINLVDVSCGGEKIMTAVNTPAGDWLIYKIEKAGRDLFEANREKIGHLLLTKYGNHVE